jgi:hypothetical protein
MTLPAAAIGLTIAIFVVDRLLLAAEAKGWIYYRRKRSSPGTSASAFLELQSMLEPGRHYELRELRADDSEQDESGDPPATETPDV